MVNFLAVFAVGACLGIAVAYVIVPVLQVAVGYPALLACAGIFVQQRSILDIQTVDFAHRAELSLVSITVNYNAKTVIAKLLGGFLGSQVAKYRNSTGCSLGELPLSPDPAPFSGAPLPDRCKFAPNERVQAALESHAIRFPNAKTLSIAVMKASTSEILGSFTGPYAWTRNDAAMYLGWSMTKSILNAFIGIRVRQGKLDLNRTALFPEWCVDRDERCNISVLQLLQMSSGLHFDETYGPFSGATRMLFANTDIAKFAIDHKHGNDGARFHYSSATTNILTAVLRNSFDSPQDFADFPRKELFEPLGMSSALIQTDSKGLFIMSSFGFASMCDWLSFGALYARNGRASNGQQILTEEWISMTTVPNLFAPHGQYGLHWWHAPDNTTKDNKPFRYSHFLSQQKQLSVASGYQGQSLSVFPASDIVVARFGLTTDDASWDLASLLEDVLKAHANQQ